MWEIICAGPPEGATFFNFPSAAKPIQRPSADQKGREGLKARGVAIANAKPAFVKSVMAQAKQLDDEWIKGANAKGVDGAKVLAEFRAELKKVASGK